MVPPSTSITEGIPRRRLRKAESYELRLQELSRLVSEDHDYVCFLGRLVEIRGRNSVLLRNSGDDELSEGISLCPASVYLHTWILERLPLWSASDCRWTASPLSYRSLTRFQTNLQQGHRVGPALRAGFNRSINRGNPLPGMSRG
jgi:hypothetical protein